MALRTQAVSRTDVGLVRRRNEDALFQGTWLYAVADGLGGHVAGDVASKIAISALEPHDMLVAVDDLADTLGRAVSEANEAIRQRIRRDPALSGMGTTMVALLHAGDSAVLANIGDSRAFAVRNFRAQGPLVQLTEDHTYQNLLARADAVPNLPEKITRFLDGRGDGRSADLTKLSFSEGDRVLLCSDGLSSYVPPDQLHGILTAPGTAEEAAENLIAAALGHGAPDNVTVIVIDNVEQD